MIDLVNADCTGSTSLGALIQGHQTSLGITDADLASALGFKHVRVIEMIKSGRMSLPLVKVPLLASSLGLELWEVLKLAADGPTLAFLKSLSAPER